MAILGMFIVAGTISEFSNKCAATKSEFSDIGAATIPEFSIIKGVMKKKILVIDLNNKINVLFKYEYNYIALILIKRN